MKSITIIVIVIISILIYIFINYKNDSKNNITNNEFKQSNSEIMDNDITYLSNFDNLKQDLNIILYKLDSFEKIINKFVPSILKLNTPSPIIEINKNPSENIKITSIQDNDIKNLENDIKEINNNEDMNFKVDDKNIDSKVNNKNTNPNFFSIIDDKKTQKEVTFN